MTTALSPTAPVIKLSPMVTDSDKNMQQGYMQIFAGAMTGIRNPKAHGNQKQRAGQIVGKYANMIKGVEG